MRVGVKREEIVVKLDEVELVGGKGDRGPGIACQHLHFTFELRSCLYARMQLLNQLQNDLTSGHPATCRAINTHLCGECKETLM
jgi:hypothetical protein